MISYTVFLLAIISLFDIVSAGTCPNGWDSYGSNCYHFSKDKETFIDAMVMCNLDGGILAEIETADEYTYLNTEAKRLKAQFWIGGSDKLERNAWRWMTSHKPINASLLDWGPGQPDNYDGFESCLEINHYKHMNDRPCTYIQRYICETIYTDLPEIVG